MPWWSYTKRSPEEIICDVFAAELLLPYRLFKPLADEAAIEMTSIEDLAERFLASITVTGSRFAAVHFSETPQAQTVSYQWPTCAFVSAMIFWPHLSAIKSGRAGKEYSSRLRTGLKYYGTAPTAIKGVQLPGVNLEAPLIDYCVLRG